MFCIQDDYQTETDTRYCLEFLFQTDTRLPNRYSFAKQILVCQTDICLFWCMCLGLVQKGADQASDPGSWLKIFDQNLCLASNIYIVYYSGVFFFFGKTIQRQQKDR